MTETDDQDPENVLDLIPATFKYPFITGLILLFGVLTVLMWKGGSIDFVRQNRSTRIKDDSDGSEQMTKRTDANSLKSQKEHPPESEESHGTPFTVQRSGDNRYTFRFSDHLDGVRAGARVSVSLHWQERPFEPYQKQLPVDASGKMNVEWSPGRPGKGIPPGIYRIRISGSELLRRPSFLSNLPEYLSREEQKQSGMFRINDSQALEYAVSVGSGSEVRTFHEQILCELKKRGRSLISAWKNWLQFAQRSYDKDRDRAKIAQELFDRFMTVNDAVRDVRGWIEKQEEKYVLLPYRNLRGELLKLSYVLSKKVNALSMTVLRQVGISPVSWPGPYVRRGFGSNINVLRHMSQYDRETIRDVEMAIDNARLNLPYVDLKSYGLYRLKHLFQFIKRFEKFKSHPYRQVLSFHLSQNGNEGSYRFRSLNRYVQDVIRVRKKGLSEVISVKEPKALREPYEDVLTKLPAYSTSVFRELATSLDLNPSGIPGMKTSPRTSLDSIRSRIDRKLKRIESSVRLREDDDINCE